MELKELNEITEETRQNFPLLDKAEPTPEEQKDSWKKIMDKLRELTVWYDAFQVRLHHFLDKEKKCLAWEQELQRKQRQLEDWQRDLDQRERRYERKEDRGYDRSRGRGRAQRNRDRSPERRRH